MFLLVLAHAASTWSVTLPATVRTSAGASSREGMAQRGYSDGGNETLTVVGTRDGPGRDATEQAMPRLTTGHPEMRRSGARPGRAGPSSTTRSCSTAPPTPTGATPSSSCSPPPTRPPRSGRASAARWRSRTRSCAASDDPASGATEQDPKAPTFALSADFTASPYFRADLPSVSVPLDGGSLDITNFWVDGTVSSDGRSLGGAGMGGLVDTRGMVSLLGTDDPAAICDLLAGFGVPCETCPDGDRYCVTVEIDRMSASEVRGLTLVEVTGGGLTCAAGGLLPVGWAVSALARRRRRAR